jgi:AbrB family looped-hinge helix DNA binding protein
MARYDIKKARPSRVRETSPAYGEPARGPEQPLGFKVTIADRGRMVLPVEVRERLKIKDGDWLTLVLEPNGEIRMLTGAVYASRLRGMFKHLGKPGHSMADDLIAERRRDAAMEQREIRAFLARRRANKKRP